MMPGAVPNGSTSAFLHTFSIMYLILNGMKLKIILPTNEEKYKYTYSELIDEMNNQIWNVKEKGIKIAEVSIPKDVFEWLVERAKESMYYEPTNVYRLFGYDVSTY